MKSKVVDVTPAMAVAWLEATSELIGAGKFRQRPMNTGTVDQYARAMRDGKWVLTHQGIALGTNGAVLDGQHRLEAVARSGVTVPMLVTVEVELVGTRNGYKVMTMDAIDRGRLRNIGQQLQIGHGIANGSKIAAICRAIAVAFTWDAGLKVSITDCLAIHALYERPLVELQAIDHTWQKNSAVAAGLILGLVAGDKGRTFAVAYLTGDHHSTDPANILKRWLANQDNHGGNAVLQILSGTAHCLKAQFEGRTMEHGYASRDSLAWLIDQQGRQETKVRGLFEICTTKNLNP